MSTDWEGWGWEPHLVDVPVCSFQKHRGVQGWGLAERASSGHVVGASSVQLPRTGVGGAGDRIS